MQRDCPPLPGCHHNNAPPQLPRRFGGRTANSAASLRIISWHIPWFGPLPPVLPFFVCFILTPPPLYPSFHLSPHLLLTLPVEPFLLASIICACCVVLLLHCPPFPLHAALNPSHNLLQIRLSAPDVRDQAQTVARNLVQEQFVDDRHVSVALSSKQEAAMQRMGVLVCLPCTMRAFPSVACPFPSLFVARPHSSVALIPFLTRSPSIPRF